MVQAVALADVVDRSLLHHAPLSAVTPAIVVVGTGHPRPRRAARRRRSLGPARSRPRRDHAAAAGSCEHALALGPGWLAGERPGELSLTATRGLRSLHTYYAALPAPGRRGRRHPAHPAGLGGHTGLAVLRRRHRAGAGRAGHDDRVRPRGDQAIGAAVAPARLAGRARPAARRRACPRCAPSAARRRGAGRSRPPPRACGSATMRTLRVAFLSALSMDMIAGFGVGLVAMVLGLRLLWGELGLQTAMAVLLVAPEIFIPLRRAGAEFHASTEGQAAAARVLDVLGDARAALGGRRRTCGRAPTHATRPTRPTRRLRQLDDRRPRRALRAPRPRRAPAASPCTRRPGRGSP